MTAKTKRLVTSIAAVSCLAGMSLVTMGAGAPPNIQKTVSNTGEKVICVKDITSSSHFRVTYTVYNHDHQLLMSKSVTPLSDSLVEFTIESLSTAKSRHQMYFSISKSEPLREEFNQIHLQLFNRDNSKKSILKYEETLRRTISNPLTVSNNGGNNYTASGSFYAYTNPTSDLSYSIDYTDDGSVVDVNNFNISEVPGGSTVYLDSVNWDGNQYNWPTESDVVPQTYYGAFSYPLNFGGFNGFPFTTEVLGDNGVYYSSYVTLTNVV